MNQTFTRADRVASLIQQTLSGILTKNIKDPRLEMVVISHVKVSGDLKNAKIYYSTGNTDRKTAAQGLKSASGYIKRELGKELDLRYMPDIQFLYDESFDRASRIDQILKSLNSDHETDNPRSDEV